MISINTSLLILLTSFSLFAKQTAEDKIHLLKKKLLKEELILEEKIAFIDKLKRQIYHAEIALIESRVDSMEKHLASFDSLPLSYEKDSAHIFLHERQVLSSILEIDPNDPRAGALLERILRMITAINRKIDGS